MSDSTASTCPSCGALVPDTAEVCDLCGTSISDGSSDPPAEGDEPASGDEPVPDRSDAGDDASSVYCNACGWENPPDARYCSQCGERLQDTSEAQPAPVPADLPPPDSRGPDASPDAPESRDESASSDASESEESGMVRQVGLIVGVGVLIVVGLFLITSWSDAPSGNGSTDDAPLNAPAQNGPADAGTAGGPGAPMTAPGGNAEGSASPTDLSTLVETLGEGADPLPTQLQERIDSLQAVVERSSGETKQAARREMANAYIGAGRLGEAALHQRRTAEATDDPDDWRRTGDLLYSWMESVGNQPESRSIAQHVVQAYQRVLDQQPDNVDVRTDMATAYLQTNNPMRGVDEINRVLEEEPDHFQARFNKGIMLTMIGRVEEAVTQFERVKEIVGEDSPYYEQADQAIRTIRQRQEGQ